MTGTDTAKFGKANFRPMAMPEREKEKRRCGSGTLKLKKQVIPAELRQWKKHFSGSE